MELLHSARRVGIASLSPLSHLIKFLIFGVVVVVPVVYVKAP